MEYDEQKILTEYVWRYCLDQMTHFEKLGWKTVAAREKATATDNESMKRMLLQKFGSEDDPEVVEALSGGSEAFRFAVRDRILRDYPEVVNRCLKCERVLRTPRAKQCMWCHYDWHKT